MIRIITDSVTAVPAEEAACRNIEVLTLYVNRDGVEYEDATMDVDAFYQDIYAMADNIPTSSQPSTAAFEQVFTEAAEAGDSVLGIFLSSKLSGTYDGAVRAARSVASNHIGFDYEIIDSRSCGFDEGFAILAAADARDAGKTLAECAAAALHAVESSRFLFTPESLLFLQKGGRIGGAAAFLGNLVKLCPILTVRDGEAFAAGKVRTRTKALARIVEMFKADIEECGLKNAVVHYIGDKTPALEWAREKIEPIVGHAVEVLPVSPVIGLHVGPAVGIAYECLRKVNGKVTFDVRTLACDA